MPIRMDTTISAANAVLEFEGVEIGELQEFTVDENFGTVRVKGIGSPGDVVHVPGFYEPTITSSRAFINGDVFFTLLGTVDISKLDTESPEIDQVKSALIETVLSKGVKGAAIKFDIKVKNSTLDSAGNRSSQVLTTYHECSIATKRWSLTTGNVIIMENATFFPRYKSFGDAKEIVDANTGVQPTTI